MANSFTFKSLDFSTLGLTLLRGDRFPFPEVQVSPTRLGSGDGATAPPSIYGPRSFSLRCLVSANTPTLLNTAMDNIAAALNEREDQALAFDKLPGRFWNARVQEFSAQSSSPREAIVDLGFLAVDPFAYDDDEDTDDDTIIDNTGESFEIAVGGTFTTYPTITIVVNASGTQCVVENDTLDQRLEWAGTLVSGDSLRFNSDPFTRLVEFKANGGDEWIASMTGVNGRHPGLAPDATNTLTIYGVTGTMATVRRDRYV